MLDYLKREPVRVRVYTLAVLVLGYLATRGIVTPEDVDFYVTVAGVVLGVETARRKVSPDAPKPRKFSGGKTLWFEVADDTDEPNIERGTE